MRQKKYRKNDDWLFDFNDNIEPLQKQGKGSFIFVYGVPRSGTTYLTQCLCHYRDVGYVSNIAARFWKAPNIGIKISKQLTGYQTDFKSDYGQTKLPGDIHQFGYFWKHHLPYMKSLEKGLRSVASEWDVPIVMKNLYGSFHIEQINRICDCKWVWICRGPEAVKRSLLKARIDYYGTTQKSWGILPPGYDNKGTPSEQIERQVNGLMEYYEKTFPSNGIKIQYSELKRDISIVESI